MNFRHLLGCDTIVFENTRSGLSKTRNEQNNNNLARHAKVHGLLYFAQDAQDAQLRIRCLSAQYMRNICARFAQDCTYFRNAQYMCKFVLISPMCNICARLYLTSNLKLLLSNYGVLIIGDMLFSGFKVSYGSGEMS